MESDTKEKRHFKGHAFLPLSHLLSGTYIPESVADTSLTIHPDDQNAMKANLITIDQQQS